MIIKYSSHTYITVDYNHHFSSKLIFICKLQSIFLYLKSYDLNMCHLSQFYPFAGFLNLGFYPGIIYGLFDQSGIQ